MEDYGSKYVYFLVVAILMDLDQLSDINDYLST